VAAGKRVLRSFLYFLAAASRGIVR
jgi:hypothetical protein